MRSLVEKFPTASRRHTQHAESGEQWHQTERGGERREQQRCPSVGSGEQQNRSESDGERRSQPHTKARRDLEFA
jgi:hypothetical protein